MPVEPAMGKACGRHHVGQAGGMDSVSAKLRGRRLNDSTSRFSGFELRLLHPTLPFQPTPWENVIDSLPARPLLPILRTTV